MADSQDETSREKMDISYVEQRYSFAQKEQWVQIFFIVFMAAFLTLGILGLFGSGYLSEKTYSGGTFDIEYNRFLREDTSTDFYIYLKNHADSAVVSIPGSYIKEVQIQQITPEPEMVRMANNKIHYHFNTDSTGVIAFYLNPEWSGTKELEVGIQGEVVTLKQFVYF